MEDAMEPTDKSQCQDTFIKWPSLHNNPATFNTVFWNNNTTYNKTINFGHITSFHMKACRILFMYTSPEEYEQLHYVNNDYNNKVIPVTKNYVINVYKLLKHSSTLS